MTAQAREVKEIVIGPVRASGTQRLFGFSHPSRRLAFPLLNGRSKCPVEALVSQNGPRLSTLESEY
jgi:hypothetical protein